MLEGRGGAGAGAGAGMRRGCGWGIGGVARPAETEPSGRRRMSRP